MVYPGYHLAGEICTVKIQKITRARFGEFSSPIRIFLLVFLYYFVRKSEFSLEATQNNHKWGLGVITDFENNLKILKILRNW